MPRNLTIEQLRYALRGREIRLEALIAERVKVELEIARIQSDISDILSLTPVTYSSSPLNGLARRTGYAREARGEKAPVRVSHIEFASPELESLL